MRMRISKLTKSIKSIAHLASFWHYLESYTNANISIYLYRGNYISRGNSIPLSRLKEPIAGIFQFNKYLDQYFIFISFNKNPQK
jgi:hypothetical protein